MDTTTKIFFLLCISVVAVYNYSSRHVIRLRPSEKEATRLFVYNYVVNVTEIVTEKYLKRLRKTINLNEFPSHLNLSMEESFPCLIPKEIRIKYPTTKYVEGTKFTMPFIFANPLGRLGNAMGEYATQFALSKVYDIPTALTPNMRRVLIGMFPHLSMEQLPLDMDTDTLNCMDLPSDSTYNFAPSEIAAAGLFGLHCFDIQNYPFDMRIFSAVRKQIIREFTFSDEIQQTAREFFTSIQESVTQMKEFQDFTETYIGVHARRTDYISHLQEFGGTIPDDSFFIRAFQYYRKKFPMPIFIVSSDDKAYMQNVLQNEIGVFYSTGQTPEIDMATLSMCNHSIFSVGSFGFWTAYLSGGEVLYADVETTKPYTFTRRFYEDARLSNFIPIPAHS